MAPEREHFLMFVCFSDYNYRTTPRCISARLQAVFCANAILPTNEWSPEEASRIEFPTSEITSGQGSNAACRVLYNVLSMSSQMFSSGPSGTNTGIYTSQGNILALPYGMWYGGIMLPSSSSLKASIFHN